LRLASALEVSGDERREGSHFPQHRGKEGTWMERRQNSPIRCCTIHCILSLATDFEASLAASPPDPTNFEMNLSRELIETRGSCLLCVRLDRQTGRQTDREGRRRAREEIRKENEDEM